VTLDLSAFLATHNPELIHLRRHLHAHPELGKAERQTTALVASGRACCRPGRG
jgi:metal-dependent amidase/aminoacylase/carboxypeptidase family protein